MISKGHPFQPKCSISITNSAGVTMVFHDEEAIFLRDQITVDRAEAYRQGAEDMRNAVIGELFRIMIGCGHDVANNIRALKPAPKDPCQRIRDWVAPLDRLSDEQLKEFLSYDWPEVCGKDEDPPQP